MSLKTVGELHNWLTSLSKEELEEGLASLTLRQNGSWFAQMDRMQQWLLGNYTAEDFEEEEGDADALRIKREASRATFIDQTVAEVTADTIDDHTYERGATHPLALIQNDPKVNENITGRSSMSNTEINLPPPNSNTNETSHQQQNVTNRIDTTSANNNRQPQQIEGEEVNRHDIEPLNQLTGLDGQQYAMPPGMLQYLQRLGNEVTRLRESLEETRQNQQTGARASSTRIEQTPVDSTAINNQDQRTNRSTEPQRLENAPHVNFRDTFTCYGNSSPIGRNSDILPQVPHPTRQTRRADETRTTEGAGETSFSLPRDTSRGWARNSARDVGQIVRKWDVRFSGERAERIDIFLTRVEECRHLANLSEPELMAALPELMTGVAATWYRNNRHQWQSWGDFSTAANRWYGTNRRFQQRLASDADKRRQGEFEPVRDYITCLHGIMMKQIPTPSLETQLDLLHKNLRPEILNHTPRRNCTSIESLLELAQEAELIIETGRYYTPPPPPEQSLLPDLAYHPPKDKPKTKISAVATEKEDREKDLATMFAKMLDEKFKEWTEKTTKEANQRVQTAPANEARRPWTQRTRQETRTCYECNKPGHLRRHCPEKKGNGDLGA